MAAAAGLLRWCAIISCRHDAPGADRRRAALGGAAQGSRGGTAAALRYSRNALALAGRRRHGGWRAGGAATVNP